MVKMKFTRLGYGTYIKEREVIVLQGKQTNRTYKLLYKKELLSSKLLVF